MDHQNLQEMTDKFVPKEAYLYFPEDGEDLYFTAANQTYRRIFEPPMILNEKEEKAIEEFLQVAKNNNVIFSDPL